MECSKRRRQNKWRDQQRYSRHNNTEDPEYHVVNDQEGAHNVHIQPARPLQANREYADRQLSRSSSKQSLCSNSSGTSDRLPRCPPRNTPFHQGPAVNRALKPTRNKVPLDKRASTVEPREQHGHLSQRSHSTLTQELVNRITSLQLQKPCRRDEWRGAETAEFRASTEDLQSCGDEAAANHTSLRYSLDLDIQCPLDKRSHQKSKWQERSSMKHRNHEWPQTRGDFDQHDFVPKEKPPQTYHHEDWYVGPCNRADAEHALHLVNEDGAFLVRDCSKNDGDEPYVLTVYHEKKVYNIKIRYIEKASKYALGTRQRENDMFDSVADIIKFHTIFPIVIINGRNTTASRLAGNCVLTCPTTKRDVEQLLGLKHVTL
ncbi:cytokine-dependent hematopoietic cell linker [Lampris incognitus]|uniref:cytokine-dependent hematopoietic cell linker n=1 Tax=Lampris incognitus TaxID=2546036 RepID=UPI0024B4F3DF|nr:cytokine-dependent hematopoietic cell linker [Lampris incognitus]XP_056136832.1 cytokine-dependent hematopoietic cell linker [Lampris incognitus]XP_056136840.1 cytokine-dependent hematopoietic cell linker [Lampris incognitus]